MDILKKDPTIRAALDWYNVNLYDMPPKNKLYLMYHIVNTFKGATLPLCLCLIYLTGNFSTRACLYTALHGSYGVVWILKDLLFPDKSFRTRLSKGSCVAAAAFLSCYLMIGVYTIAM